MGPAAGAQRGGFAMGLIVGLVIGLALALGVGGLTGVMRVAFGGHFPSDVLFAGLFTLIIVALLRQILIKPDKQGLRGDDPYL